jgi:hypothetical protein
MKNKLFNQVIAKDQYKNESFDSVSKSCGRAFGKDLGMPYRILKAANA